MKCKNGCKIKGKAQAELHIKLVKIQTPTKSIRTLFLVIVKNIHKC